MNAVVETRGAPERPPRTIQPAEVEYSSLPKLTEALAAAKDRCHAAIKAAYNDYHKYPYASAEEVLTVAHEALQGSGLTLIPVRARLSTLGTLPAVYTLDRVFLLTHSSGERVSVYLDGWPVVPDRGRPLDKAFASALTTSLAYQLRDLLQMPRVEEGAGDIAEREDRPPQQQAAPPAANGVTPGAAERVVAFEARLVEEGLCAKGDLARHLAGKFGAEWAGRPIDQLKAACLAYRSMREAEAKQSPRQPAAEQYDFSVTNGAKAAQLLMELDRVGGTWPGLCDLLRSRGFSLPQKPKATDLSAEAYEEAMAALGEMPDRADYEDDGGASQEEVEE